MADTLGTYSAEQVERLLVCSVCLDRYNNPKILPCQHTFCRSPCLEGLIDRSTSLLRCPECRATHFVPRDGANGFPTNITVSSFLDLNTQRDPTPRDGITSARSHPVSSPSHCAACGSEATTIKCFHCEAMVCDSCKRLHLGQMKIDLGRLVSQVRRGIPQLSNTVSAVEQRSETLKTQVETVKSEVKDTIQRYTKELKDREKMLLSELDTFLQGEQRSLRLHQENIEVELASITSYCDSTEGCLNQSEASAIPEGDLVSIRRQCSEYLTQIQNTATSSNPDLREVTFRCNGQAVHSSISSLGEIQLMDPQAGPSARDNNAPSRSMSQPVEGRGRWSDVQPVDMSLLDNIRVSSSFSYAPTPRTGRRSHSPPPVANTSSHYRRPGYSSADVGASSDRLYRGYNPGQTLPSVRNMPSRLNDYMYRMDAPSPDHMLDIMDRNRAEEFHRRQQAGNRLRPSVLIQERARRERADRLAGFMGSDFAATSQSTGPDVSTTGPYNVIPHINPSTNTTVEPSRSRSPVDSRDVSRATAEAAERRARNVAPAPRPAVTRPAAAFVIPLHGETPEEIIPDTQNESATQQEAVSSQGTGIVEPRPEQPQEQEQSQQQDRQQQQEAPQQLQQPEGQVEPEQQQQGDEASQQTSQQSAPGTAAESSSTTEAASIAQSHGQATVTDNGTNQAVAQDDDAVQPSTSSQPSRQPQTGASQRGRGPQTGGTRGGSQPRDRRRKKVTRSSSNNESGVQRNRAGGPQLNRSNSSTASNAGTSSTTATTEPTCTNTTNAAESGNSNAENNASAPVTTGSTTPPSPIRSRARTFVQESGPVTTSSNLPVINGLSSTYDIPLSESLGDLDPSQLDQIQVESSNSPAQPAVDYRSKGAMKLQIGAGERGNSHGRFTWPRGVAVSSVDDAIVVADSSNHKVQVFDRNGQFVTTFGSYGQGSGEFDCLAGVAVSRSGEIVIADRYNHRIQIFGQSGQFVRSFGSEGDGAGGQMKYPWGVATDMGGFVYVCDKENHRIQVFQGNGTFVRMFGRLGNQPGQLENPHYICVGYDGHVYVSDCSNHRIQVFSDTGRFVRTIGTGEGSGNGQLKNPKGVAVDRQGFVVVADSGNNRVQVFYGDGRFYSVFGSWGSEPGQFKGMEGLALTSNGDIVVSDKENHRIQIF